MRPQLAAELTAHPEVCHLWVEDGKGKPLGRAFRVKLWPTLVFLRDGQVVKQMARPTAGQVREGFKALGGGAGQDDLENSNP